MIIVGTKVKHCKIEEGEFFCPKCQADRIYHHKRAIRFFTLYFIPVIPLTQIGEFIECQSCGLSFVPRVREMRREALIAQPQHSLATILNSARQRLENGMPIDYLIRDLTAANLDLEIARGLVANAIGPQQNVCDRCGLSYASHIHVCSECSSPLHPAGTPVSLPRFASITHAARCEGSLHPTGTT
jgi:transcription elongation factor Elf1